MMRCPQWWFVRWQGILRARSRGQVRRWRKIGGIACLKARERRRYMIAKRRGVRSRFERLPSGRVPFAIVLCRRGPVEITS